MERSVLIVDAAINLVLGLLLIAFPQRVVDLLGVPTVEQSFYPSILGAVLTGIGIALLVECFRAPGGLIGLGLGGAIAINLSGGVVLAGWLASGKLSIPLRGEILLWMLVAALVLVSGTELVAHARSKDAGEAC
jgi:hypothetical protein